MTSISIEVEDLQQPLRLTLGPDEVLLLGRAPDAARLPDELRRTAPRTLTVPSALVSANHLLLCASPPGVLVQDLRSRNGTWLRLAPGQGLTLPGRELRLALATAPQGEARAAPAFPAAAWHERSGFAVAVVAVLRAGLGDAADCQVAHRPGPSRGSSAPTGASGDPGCFALADGSAVLVRLGAGLTLGPGEAALLDRVRAYVHAQNLRYEREGDLPDDFILASPPMRAVHDQVLEAAAYGVRLMLLGPTGAGKDRLARRYHERSRQHRGPYVPVNCALLSKAFIQVHLFGARKGAYTDSKEDVTGAVAAAHQGTLFLDEIGELPLDVQGTLLRFLDSGGEYERLGEPGRRRTTEVQLVCATNLDLTDPRVRAGRFREDLWYRLSAQVARVPPLRERPEDIAVLLRRRSLRAVALSVHDALDDEARRLVLADPWPGNFRDLENFLARLPATSAPGGIDAAQCQRLLAQGRAPGPLAAEPMAPAPAGAAPDLAALCAQAVAAYIEDHGEAPRAWGALQALVERYLKPLFVAVSLGPPDRDGALNYSALARRLDIADGTTVKVHLRRYHDRFKPR